MKARIHKNFHELSGSFIKENESGFTKVMNVSNGIKKISKYLFYLINKYNS